MIMQNKTNVVNAMVRDVIPEDIINEAVEAISANEAVSKNAEEYAARQYKNAFPDAFSTPEEMKEDPLYWELLALRTKEIVIAALAIL